MSSSLLDIQDSVIPESIAPTGDLLARLKEETGDIPQVAIPPYIARTQSLIEWAQQERISRNEFGGLTLGSDRFHQLNLAWGGIDKGIHLIGGDSNLGKSALMRMMAWDMFHNNPNIHIKFYTLDDSVDYFLDALVAQAAKVPINAVNKPKAWENLPETQFMRKSDYIAQVKRGNEMYLKIAKPDFLERFSVIGTAELGGPEWQRVESDILQTKAQVEAQGLQLAVMIDNFHDIETDDGNADMNSKTERIANQAKVLSERAELTIIGSAQLKKTGTPRRPYLDDICGSRRWKYGARSVVMLYSEVGMGKPNPRLFYERADAPGIQQSVLEVKFHKSKTSSFKGCLFYHQVTEMGLMKEVTPDQAKSYASLIS